jgi:hypothetical protein
MASLQYSLPPVLAERWDARRWPATLLRRTILRALLCLPFMVLGAWEDHRQVQSAVDLDLVRAGQAITFGSSKLDFLAHAYPPVPVVLARLVPGSPGSLAVFGALCAGGLLHICWERLARARVQGWLVALLLVGLAGTPIFWFNATENFVGFLGLACFAVAMAGTLDFLFSARTSGGFAAGLSLALAVLCDPAALVYAVSLIVAVPFLAWERFRDEPHIIRSTFAVLAFPTLAVLAAWTFLEWRFTGAVWHPLSVAPYAFRFHDGVLTGFVLSVRHVGWQVLCSPVFLVSAALVLRRRPVAFLGFLAVPLDLVLTSWFGLHTPTEQGLVLLSVLGVLAVPTQPNRLERTLYAVAVPAGVAASLLFADGPGVGSFLRGIGL